jgi:hypothetical protein
LIFAQAKEQYSILDKVVPPNSNLRKKSIDLNLYSYQEFVSQLKTKKYIFSIPEIFDTSRLNEYLTPDSLYFSEQIKLHINWDQKEIVNRSIKVRRGLNTWIYFRHIFDKDFFLQRSYYKISRPFFINRQNNAALIYFERYDGPVSGEGGYFITIKIGQKWCIIGYDPIYIS